MIPIQIKYWLFMGLGFVSMALGIIGIVVPVMPTSPFLILSAACFLRSSKGHYKWLVNNRWLGPYVHDYMEHRALTKKVKIISIVCLWGSIIISGLVFVSSWWVRGTMAVIAVAVTIYLLRLATYPQKGDR